MKKSVDVATFTGIIVLTFCETSKTNVERQLKCITDVAVNQKRFNQRKKQEKVAKRVDTKKTTVTINNEFRKKKN